MDWRRELKKGIKSGLPIGIGYIPVSFTFGFLAVSGGLPIWVAVVISLTNLTSAGQFAGTNLIFAGAGYLEVALTTFVINIRYMLMSLSLSQKLERKTGTLARLALAFGITDETFVVGSLKPGTLTAPFMLGLILMPIAGWNLGTLMGGCISTLLPQALQNAMGIALYAMFIALIIPAAKASVHVLCIICIAVAVQCGLNYIPVFSFLSDGFRVIISTVAAAGLGAWLFPGTDDSGETEKTEKAEDAADEAAEETAKETDGKMREKAQKTGGDGNGA